MAYQFADGFDTYGNAFSLVNGYPWDFVQGSLTTNTDARFAPPGSTPGFSISVSGSQNICRKNLASSQTQLIVGFGFKLGSLPGGSPVDIIDFWSSGNCQCSLAVSNAGALQFYLANGGTLGGGLNPILAAIGQISNTVVIKSGIWYGVALSVSFSTTVGTVSLFINGGITPVISSGGLNTCGSGVASANQVSLGMCTNPVAGGIKYDDFYCFDSSGGSLNSLIGSDARIVTKMPSGAGNYTNWTPNGLGSNWQNASQQPPNVADYNANNTGGTKDSYAMQSSGIVASPLFFLVRSSLLKDDGGSHTPSLFVRSGANDSAGVVTPALGASYVYYDALFPNDPSTGTPWGGSGADNAQVGVIEG